MKKINTSYLAMWIGIPLAIIIVLALLSYFVFLETSQLGFLICTIGELGIIVAVPMLLESRMKKSASKLEAGFAAQGFNYQYKFQASNAVYYIDQGGKMGVVYKCNPVLQFADLSKITDVRVNDGKFGAGTSQVSCEFRLNGKKVRIATLKVSRGALSMKDKRVLEAISKADQLCSMINTAVANAKN